MKVKVGISACLLGEKVRYDGGHKRSLLCSEALSRYFEYVPLCPEVGIGMGVPREPIQLVGDVYQPRALGVEDPDVDVSDRLRAYANAQQEVLRDICGYIFMERSPSCGLFGVDVFDVGGRLQAQDGRGIFAGAVIHRFPDLPVEEAGRLQEPELREDFVARVFSYHQSLP